jgi:hypothetical protein
MLRIITRAEAKAQELRRYFTGEPCKHVHIRRARANKSVPTNQGRLAMIFKCRKSTMKSDPVFGLSRSYAPQSSTLSSGTATPVCVTISSRRCLSRLHRQSKSGML